AAAVVEDGVPANDADMLVGDVPERARRRIEGGLLRHEDQAVADITPVGPGTDALAAGEDLLDAHVRPARMAAGQLGAGAAEVQAEQVTDEMCAMRIGGGAEAVVADRGDLPAH